MVTQTQTYTKDWLENGQILCYRFQNSLPDTIDEWVADLSQELSRWPADKRLLLIHDIRVSGASPYSLNHARKLSLLRPELVGRNAILIPASNHLVAQMVNICMRTLAKYDRQREMFTDEAIAVEWLLDYKPRHCSDDGT